MTQKTLTHDQMVREVRKYLMKVCKENLECRWELWAKIINEETDKINRELFGEIGSDIFEAKLSKKQIKVITQFIKNWHGLKIVEVSKIPTHIKQYKEKARSWLNGRRAMQYSRNLYPEMIKKAHKFTIKLAQTYFVSIITKMDNYDKISDDIQYIKTLKQNYIKILMSSYIVRLCEVKMTLNERSKRVYLLCPNSIKSKKSLTRKELQKFGDECDEKSREYKGCMPYYKHFPGHRNMARDYFYKKGENTLEELKKKLRRLKDEEIRDISPIDSGHSSSDSLPSYRPQLQQNKSNSKSISMEYPPISPSPDPPSNNSDEKFLNRLLNDIKSTEKNGRVTINLNQLQSITMLLEYCEQSYNQTQSLIHRVDNSTKNICRFNNSYITPPCMDLDDIHETREIINISSEDEESHNGMTIDNDANEINWPDTASLFQSNIDCNYNESMLMPFESRLQSVDPSINFNYNALHSSHSYGINIFK